MFGQREGSLRGLGEEETAGALEFKLFVDCFIIIDKKNVMLHFNFCFGLKHVIFIIPPMPLVDL